ncbi:YqiA/YcfP family alpha/beta fold hydrolase [Endozoicomonas arenosclerae]|uniref:YqiA/YcfP family alpha/beta fold hydrolase n=1 Tax=Endozoicomonas arenosclerae TaxID=1633495 RepID=UPI0007862FEE|nr:YqiA/YcfP family alpha/beta fold hydrolase [Endozoicomonas arenosclerae]
MTKKPLLIYLHGFNSAPASVKAQQTLKYLDQNRIDIEPWVPKLPNEPGAVKALLKERLLRERTCRHIYIIGSSLGGYIGTWLRAQIHALHPEYTTRLVLINPAVRPYEGFTEYLGPQVNEYTDEEWELTPDHVEQLKTLDIATLRQPEEIFLLVQTGDEVLDYRKAVEKYSGSEMLIQEGGNHAFEHYDRTLPMVFQFLSGRSIDRIML